MPGEPKRTFENCPTVSFPSRRVHSNSFSYRRPMCSSPAYPTLAFLDGSTSRDTALISGPVTARIEDAWDIPRGGLLPQLIDVLNALTEGQELLSRKVRDARVERSYQSGTLAERSEHSEPSDSDARRASTVTGTNASIGIRPDRTSDEMHSGAWGPTSGDDSGNASSPDQSTSVSAAPVSATVPAASPSIPPPPIVTDPGLPDDLSSESPPADALNSAQPGDTTSEPLNRDYNFFDELDARLADLPDQANYSGDR